MALSVIHVCVFSASSSRNGDATAAHLDAHRHARTRVVDQQALSQCKQPAKVAAKTTAKDATFSNGPEGGDPPEFL